MLLYYRAIFFPLSNKKNAPLEPLDFIEDFITPFYMQTQIFCQKIGVPFQFCGTMVATIYVITIYVITIYVIIIYTSIFILNKWG